MIAQELEVSLHMAFVEARQARHEFITVEHLLLALLDNPSAAEVLRACAVNVDDLRKTLTNFINDNTPTVPGTSEVDTQPTLGFQRVIQRAIMHVQSASNGKKKKSPAPMSWWQFSVKKIPMPCITFISKVSLVSMSSTSFRMACAKTSSPSRKKPPRVWKKAPLKRSRKKARWISSPRISTSSLPKARLTL